MPKIIYFLFAYELITLEPIRLLFKKSCYLKEVLNKLKTNNTNDTKQSWPFKACDRVRAPSHAPCFVEVRDKYAPSKMFTLLRAPGNRTVCKKEEKNYFVSFFSIIQLNKVIKVIERSK